MQHVEDGTAQGRWCPQCQTDGGEADVTNQIEGEDTTQILLAEGARSGQRPS